MDFAATATSTTDGTQAPLPQRAARSRRHRAAAADVPKRVTSGRVEQKQTTTSAAAVADAAAKPVLELLTFTSGDSSVWAVTPTPLPPPSPTSFTDFVRRDGGTSCAAFFRALLGRLPRNYHCCVLPRASVPGWLAQQRPNATHTWTADELTGLMDKNGGQSFVVVVFASAKAERGGPAPSFDNDSGKAILYTDRSGKTVNPGITFDEIEVAASTSTVSSLDCQGRAMYVVTMRLERMITRMEELNDIQLAELWGAAVSLESSGPRQDTVAVGSTGIGAADLFTDMRINAGSFQNIGHLHLKCSMPLPSFLNRWVASPAWRALAKVSPDKRLLKSIRKHAQAVEKRGAAAAATSERGNKKSSPKSWWTHDTALRAALGLKKIKSRNKGGGSGGGDGNGSAGESKAAAEETGATADTGSKKTRSRRRKKKSKPPRNQSDNSSGNNPSK